MSKYAQSINVELKVDASGGQGLIQVIAAAAASRVLTELSMRRMQYKNTAMKLFIFFRYVWIIISYMSISLLFVESCFLEI
jgi:hypothetical protein